MSGNDGDPVTETGAGPEGQGGTGGTARDGTAARLSEVVFSYDRDADLDATASYGAVPDPDERDGAVLRGLDLSVPAGSFTVVMGASGGGKSTLLRTLNAIIPDFVTGSFAGQVDVFGRDATATRVSEMAEDVGMVLQDYEAQLFGTSITAEVAFGPENLGVPPAEIDDRIDEALPLVGLDDLPRHRSPGSLSGGQKQRLVFAGVLAMHPDLLVLDEPTSDLDPAGSRDVLTVIRELADEGHAADESGAAGTDGTGTRTTTDAPAGGAVGWDGPGTIVMVTHEIEEALLADRAVLLRGGRVYREGPLGEVFTDIEALRAARVAVPPVVEAFAALGWPGDDLPLTVAGAAERIAASDLTWTPPGRRGDAARLGAPAGTGESLGDALFELEGVVHEYETDRGPVRAVDGVDLTIREGEVVAIVGHNGSGKTTLAKHLNGLLDPDAGSVRWRGRDVPSLSMAEVGRSIGYVFQNPDHQIFAATVEEEVAFGPENFGLAGEELERRVTDAIETVELAGLEEADPFNLSKGQRQRVALASILATDPDTIVFDEPATGLDAAQQERFLDLVAALNREEGLTVVMITHDMSTVAHYAPRAVVVDGGRKVADGPVRDLFADPEALAGWGLAPPQPVRLSNRLAADAGIEGALPALSVPELVEGLGGDAGADGDRPDEGGGGA